MRTPDAGEAYTGARAENEKSEHVCPEPRPAALKPGRVVSGWVGGGQRVVLGGLPPPESVCAELKQPEIR